MLLPPNVNNLPRYIISYQEKYQDNAAPFWAWLYFFRGENEKALAIYTKTLKELKKASGKNSAYFKTIPGIFFILALLKDGSLASLKEAEEYANLMYRKSEPWLKSIYPQLKNLLQVQQGNLVPKILITSADIPSLEEGNSLATLLSSLCLYWVDADRAKKRLPKLLEALYHGFAVIAVW